MVILQVGSSLVEHILTLLGLAVFEEAVWAEDTKKWTMVPYLTWMGKNSNIRWH